MRRRAAAALCCLLLPQEGQALAKALQHEAVESHLNQAPGNPLKGAWLADDQEYVSSFISDGGLLCTDGPGRHIAAHLATYKASPLGGAYRESVAAFNVSCEAMGYGEGKAPDPCSNGKLNLAVRKIGDVDGVGDTRQQALDSWRGRHGVNETLGELLATCSCHPRSHLYEGRLQECENLWRPGAWLHATKTTASQVPTYTCYEGIYEYALRALATMKSTPFLVAHDADQIIPKGCGELGYSSAGVMDHCFPRLRLMTASSAAAKATGGDAQHAQTLAWSTSSFRAHLEDFDKLAKAKNLDAWDFGAQVNGCHCSPKSVVLQGLKSKKTRCGFPPVRDYWKG